MDRAGPLDSSSSSVFLPSCHSAIRDPIAYPALRFRASTLLSRENVSPLRKIRVAITCENGPAFRSGGSKVIRRLLRGRREKPGDEASIATLLLNIYSTHINISHSTVVLCIQVNEQFRKGIYIGIV